MDNTKVRADIYTAIGKLAANDSILVSDDTALFGGLFDSMHLLELCLFLEDKAEELGFEFDWVSETAMSKSRSIFNTVGSLIAEFLDQGGRN